ncbi:PP-loop family protein [Colletotrichum salicis]|uniref:PP-loop family protein n=1 Tax=Colletotrichum salicis TaxID=1209931 RepID=A0A135USY1_9PEZI|nr:PP-loop family protein [Colletotrichum salicis]
MSAADRRAEFEGILKRFAPGKVRYTLPALYAVNRDEQTGEEVLRMLALPTLGVGLPGLERWVQYEVRYRKVDMGLFEHETVGRGSRGGGWGRMPQRRGGGSDGGSGSGSGSGGRTQSSGAFVGGAVLRRQVLADGTAEERAWKRISGIRRRKRMMTAVVVVRNKKKQEEERDRRAGFGLRSA